MLRSLTSEFGRFVLVGLATVAFATVVRIGLQRWLSFRDAVAMATAISTSLNFCLNRFWTFRAHSRPVLRQVLRLAVTLLGGVVVTTVLALFTQWLAARILHGLSVETRDLVAHLSAVGVGATVVGYPVAKFFVFR